MPWRSVREERNSTNPGKKKPLAKEIKPLAIINRAINGSWKGTPKKRVKY